MWETFKAWVHFQREILLNILLNQIDEIKFDVVLNYNKLNSICWTAGSLEGEKETMEFFSSFIKSLFILIKTKNKILDDWIVIISNILYCISCF